MAFEDDIVAHLATEGYHPRSSKHSDQQSELIIRDLIAQCPLLRSRAAKGEIVAQLRHHQTVGHADWVIDIAIGTCAGFPQPPADGQIRRGPPVIIQIAIELKSIFTEHGKARKNRLRDFNSFHGYAHQYHPNTVAAAFLIVNSSEHFYSPLRDVQDITTHGSTAKSAREIAKDAVGIFRSIHLRNSVTDAPGMEAVGIVVIEHDNLNVHPSPATLKHKHIPTRLAPIPPGIQMGDPLHYQSMFQRICNAYSERFPA